MRRFLALLAVGCLAAAYAPAASAQDSVNAFGGYPAGITTGSPYGFYPGGYGQGVAAYPTAGGYAYGPRVSYYSSGYYGGTPGTMTYRPGVNFSAGNAASYGYASPRYAMPYTYTPSYGTYYPSGMYRRGLFGRRTYYR
jgi:hypothetical protein